MISEAEKRLKLMDKLTELSKKEQEAAKELDVTSVEQMQSRIAELEKKIELMDKLARLQQTEKSATSKLNEALSRKEGKRPSQEQTSHDAKKAKSEHPPNDATASGVVAPKAPNPSTPTTQHRITYSTPSKLQLKVFSDQRYYSVPENTKVWPPDGEHCMFHIATRTTDACFARKRSLATTPCGRNFWTWMVGEIQRDPKSVIVLKSTEAFYSWYILLLPMGVRYKGDDMDSAINTHRRVQGQELVSTDDLHILNIIPFDVCKILLQKVKENELWEKSGILKYAHFGPDTDSWSPVNPKLEGWEAIDRNCIQSVCDKTLEELRRLQQK